MKHSVLDQVRGFESYGIADDGFLAETELSSEEVARGLQHQFDHTYNQLKQTIEDWADFNKTEEAILQTQAVEYLGRLALCKYVIRLHQQSE